ncbi:MAG TPA: inositol monophosphatase family protein [Blastocatellia bacterium]|nr:inositol monophosphatase family protein [Blastocatellia bacterium]
MKVDYQQIKDRLLRVGELVRDHVLLELRQQSSDTLSAVAFHSAADTIYEIDRSVETILLPALQEHLAPLVSFVLICEGVNDEQPLPFPANCAIDDCELRLIVDPIDGTRPIMYNKRSAWVLMGVAPNRGDATTLADIELAVQVELPTSRAAVADSLWAIRGQGAFGETVNLQTSERVLFRPQPSRASSIRGGFAMLANFFPIGKDVLASIEQDLAVELFGDLSDNKTALFTDQYLSSGGQLYELMMGHDRMLADVRSRLYDQFARAGKATGHSCHPYDICTALIAEEAGVIVTDGRGQPLAAPMNTTADVSWIGYANPAIRDEVEPVLQALLERYGL